MARTKSMKKHSRAKSTQMQKQVAQTPRSFTSAEIAGLVFGLIAILAIIIGLAVGLTVNSGSSNPVSTNSGSTSGA